MEKLQQHIPTLEAQNSKLGTVLSFKQGVGDVLLDACHTDLVRKEIFQSKYHFKGSLCDDQYDNFPICLSALIGMILGGTNAKQSTDDYEISTPASSITQLLVFNATKRGKKEARAVRHNPDRETVLPLYLGLLIHNKTRKRDLIDVLFEKGLSVSYDRVCNCQPTKPIE